MLWDLELWLNLVAAIGAIAVCIYVMTVTPGSCFATDPSREELHRCPVLQHLTSWLVLIVWTNLMLLVGLLPKLGCYSLMLTTVTKNFLKVNQFLLL